MSSETPFDENLKRFKEKIQNILDNSQKINPAETFHKVASLPSAILLKSTFLSMAT